MTNIIKPWIAAGLIASGTFAFGAHAANMGTDMPMTKDQIEARYEQAQQACDKLKGNEEDVCEQRAKTERDKALADHEAAHDKRKAERKLAEEKCDAMSGAAKDSCEADVKAKYDR